jgi:hypothetical protein
LLNEKQNDVIKKKNINEKKKFEGSNKKRIQIKNIIKTWGGSLFIWTMFPSSIGQKLIFFLCELMNVV